jgi:very-short-patch-repair endonuclease
MSKNPIIPYKSRLKEKARELRKNPTLGEKRLWRKIRGKQLGYEFHRQVPVDRFIIDFYCHELLLAIEVDGVSHDSEAAKAKDADRQAIIEEHGVSFLRFLDEDVLNNLDGVVEEIRKWIEEFKDK